jgi:hypothetical protein
VPFHSAREAGEVVHEFSKIRHSLLSRP